MTELTKNQVMTLQCEIMGMELSELRKRAQDISLSDIDSKARFFLNSAVDLRMAQLMDIDTSGLVVMGDCDFDIDVE